ncbi:MAG: hypothetical protein QXT82_10605 [Candidatus Caldarchaeum sp.]
MSASGPPYIYVIDRSRFLFRYVRSSNEFNFIVRNHVVYSYNPSGTYWTTLLTNDQSEAQKRLSLPNPPIYRIGGIPFKDLEPTIIKKRGIVAPAYGQPGGAEEILLDGPIPIFSIFGFDKGQTVYSFLKQL